MTFDPTKVTQQTTVPLFPHLPQLPNQPTTSNLSGRKISNSSPQIDPIQPKPLTLQPKDGWTARKVFTAVLGGVAAVAAVVGAIFLAIMLSKRGQDNTANDANLNDELIAKLLQEMKDEKFVRETVVREDGYFAQNLQSKEAQIRNDEVFAQNLQNQ